MRTMCWRSRLLAALLVSLAAGAAEDPLLPPTRGAWRRVAELERYDPEHLHEKIDGMAPFYLSYGCTSLGCTAYRLGTAAAPGTAQPVTVDLYALGHSDNAFAIFRMNNPAETRRVEVGAEASFTGSTLELWQGPHYLVLTGADGTPLEPLLALAKEFAAALPPGKAFPDWLALLPTERRVPLSEQYVPEDYLGHTFLKRTIQARYTLAGGGEAVLFASRGENVEAARAALARLAAHYHGTAPLTLGDGGFSAPAEKLALWRCGLWVAGVQSWADTAELRGLAAALTKALPPPPRG